MTRRWLQLVPVLTMMAAGAIVAAIPRRTARQDRIITAVLMCAAGIIVAAFLLLLGWRYSHLIGG